MDNNINNIINIRGVNFANVTMGEAVETAKKFIDENKYENKGVFRARVIHTPNAEMVQSCIDDKTGDLYNIINSADLIIPDGAGVVLASKILKTPLKEKVAGIELAYNLLPYLDNMGGTLFLLGSKEEIVTKAVSNLNAKYKNLKVFYNNGFFDLSGVKNPEENIKVTEKINNASPDVVFVCLGSPKQEKWMHKNKEKLNAKLLIGLGGTIDDIAGVVKRAPKTMIKLNLEWLYRLIKKPSRIGRYMALPKFAFGTLFMKNPKK